MAFDPMTMGTGGALGAASGILGSGLLSDSANVPSMRDIMGGGLSYLYTGLSLDAQKKFDKLSAMTDRNPQQQAEFEKLQRNQTNAPLNQQYNAMTEWLPKYNDLMLSLMDKYAPQEIEQQAKFGQALGGAYLNAQKALAPEFYNLRSAEANQLMGQVGQGLTPQQTDYYSANTRAAQAARGLFDSPLGSTQEAYRLTALDQQQRQINDAQVQAFLNNFTQPSIPNIGNFGALPGGQFAGGAFTPPSSADAMGLRSNILGMKYASNTQQANQPWQGIGAGLSGAMSGMTGSMMGGNLFGGVGGTSSMSGSGANQYAGMGFMSNDPSGYWNSPNYKGP